MDLDCTRRSYRQASAAAPAALAMEWLTSRVHGHSHRESPEEKREVAGRQCQTIKRKPTEQLGNGPGSAKSSHGRETNAVVFWCQDPWHMASTELRRAAIISHIPFFKVLCPLGWVRSPFTVNCGGVGPGSLLRRAVRGLFSFAEVDEGATVPPPPLAVPPLALSVSLVLPASSAAGVTMSRSLLCLALLRRTGHRNLGCYRKCSPQRISVGVHLSVSEYRGARLECRL